MRPSARVPTGAFYRQQINDPVQAGQGCGGIAPGRLVRGEGEDVAREQMIDIASDSEDVPLLAAEEGEARSRRMIPIVLALEATGAQSDQAGGQIDP
jgi:hypothetical protein